MAITASRSPPIDPPCCEREVAVVAELTGGNSGEAIGTENGPTSLPLQVRPIEKPHERARRLNLKRSCARSPTNPA